MMMNAPAGGGLLLRNNNNNFDFDISDEGYQQ
jgi:hypothetical protein